MDGNSCDTPLMVSNQERHQIHKSWADAYRRAVESNMPAECPYDPDKSSAPLDDERMVLWFDGLKQERCRIKETILRRCVHLPLCKRRTTAMEHIHMLSHQILESRSNFQK